MDPTGPYGALLGPWPDCWEVASSEVTRIAIRSAFLELAVGSTGATGATGAAGMVSKTVAQTPPSTRAGGQDDVVKQTPSKKCMCETYGDLQR